MKLYSQTQLFRIILITIAATLLVSAIVFFSLGKKSSNKNNSGLVTTSVSQETQLETTEGQLEENEVQVQSDTNLAFLQTNNQLLDSTFSVSNTSYTQDESQNINVYNLCNEAVVNINTKITAYDWFLEPYVQDGGSGSGSIIDKRGYILTNVHVIQGATKIYVSLFDGTQYEAEVVGQDLDSDLAVIKFNPPEGMSLKTISFGDSTSLKVGQKVIAIGNPFGLERTMTTGIVSGLGRPIQNSNNRIIRNMVQTDAAINPGNSGGPLLDSSGRMIGINTMIKSSSGSSAGVGFAVPSETAIRVVADLLKYGKVQRGQIDATIVQLSRRIAQYAGLDIAEGILISEVVEGGNAEKAGIKGGTQAAYYGSRRDIIYIGGDVITKIDDINITSIADYYSALESKKPGDTVTLVIHRNRKDLTVKLTLSE
ncbi:MAG: trypsin-like peptidase domain-containing protein [Treponema sp.]|nr:trypsin-like peptidase domain-containing protein [Treponema sp.]